MNEQRVVLTKLICLQSVADGGGWKSVRTRIFEKAEPLTAGMLYFPTCYQGVPSEMEERGDSVEDYMVGLIEEGLVSGDVHQLQLTTRGHQLMTTLSTEAEKQGWLKPA